jgi:hypothetical protein
VDGTASGEADPETIHDLDTRIVIFSREFAIIILRIRPSGISAEDRRSPRA